MATWRRTCGVRDATIEALIDDIATQWRGSGTWTVDAATLQRTLGVSPQDYYQSIYAADLAGDRMVTLETANDRLDSASVGALVALVEHLVGPRAVAVLVAAGIYHPYEQQAELMGALLNQVASLLDGHEFQEQAYRAMLRDRRSAERARDVYLAHFFDLDVARHVATAEYCQLHGFAIPDLAIDTAERLLECLFHRHVLTCEALFARLFPRFVAAERLEEFDRTRAQDGERARPGEQALSEGGERSRARSIMGLRRGKLTAGELRNRYKELIKRFHPDVNTDGLHRCQEINGAYALLLAEVATPAKG